MRARPSIGTERLYFHERERQVMDSETARILNKITGDFYAKQSASFSDTRQSPWEGWECAFDVAVSTWLRTGKAEVNPSPALKRSSDALAEPAKGDVEEPRALAVLDLGCGNMRFERFLTSRGGPFLATAVDRCRELAEKKDANDDAHDDADADSSCTVFREADVIGAVIDDDDAALSRVCAPRGAYDLVVAFGFMHHIPGRSRRARFLEEAVRSLKPGGVAIVSFWQFLNSPRIAAKAEKTTAHAYAAARLAPGALEENDYLLGWQHADDVFRYCHHFDEREIDRLVTSISGEISEIARFSADGKSHDLNRYVVLRKNPR